MKTFDINTYEKNKDINGNYEYVAKNKNRDSIKVSIAKVADYYQKRIFKLGTPFSEIYLFDQNTLSLRQKTEYFYDCAINKMTDYDLKGKVIKETNFEASFKFTWQDLIKLMKEKYSIDLYDMNKNQRTNITRNSETLLYSIAIPTGKNMFKMGWKIQY